MLVRLMNQQGKLSAAWLLLSVVLFLAAQSGWAEGQKLVIVSEVAVEAELVGFAGFAGKTIMAGKWQPHEKKDIATPYRGLALLRFTGGQVYPVLLGNKSFTMKIISPSRPPVFTGSAENDLFYKALLRGAPIADQYPFARLMIEAKQLLDASSSLKSVAELTAMKQKYENFVGRNYQSLQHSDMLQRLMAQYFMMHEYVKYHVKGEPVSAIKKKYQQEVLGGVGRWLALLEPHMPRWRILNHCLSLYYQRGMVSMAALIADNFTDFAFCPGTTGGRFSFPADLAVLAGDGSSGLSLGKLSGNKTMAFVSTECPVSMVMAVVKARQARQRKGEGLVVVPLEKLNKKHLAMSRMVRGREIYFLNDEKWRQNSLGKTMRLPEFIMIPAGRQ